MFLKTVCLLLAAFLMGLPSNLTAACCHAILVGDTFSPTGAIAFSELQESSLALERLCIASGIDYHETLLLGENGTQELNLAIDSLEHAISSFSEDLVFFLFLGHGYREVVEASPWPTFFFFHTGESLPMQTVLDRLNLMGPRLLCVLADCCNNPGTGKIQLNLTHSVKFPQMFLNQGNGKFILAAAEAGSVAYCTDQRHCCTQALWQALDEQLCKSPPSWEAVGPRIIQLLCPLQTPYYILDIDCEKIVYASISSF